MTQQGDRQASVRAVTGTTLTYEGDWLALFDAAGIGKGTFNERMLLWINLKLGTTYTEINGALQALAAANGAFNFSSMGTFTASVAPTFVAESRPGAFALTPNQTTAGDSTVAGVGTSISPVDYSWPGQLKALLSSSTFLRQEGSGMAFAPSAVGLNTNPIDSSQILGQGATPLGANWQIFTGGLNNYNQQVILEPGSRNWVTGVLAGITNAVGGFTGGTAQRWIYLLGMAEDSSGPGMRYWSDWKYLKGQVQATWPGHVYDMRRYLQTKISGNPSNLDDIMVSQFAALPISLRGLGANLFTQSAETVMNTCTTATNNQAGIEAAAPSAGFTEGTFIQNVNTGVATGNNIWRKANGAWQQVDTKHFNQYGYAVIAQAVFDILAALKGLGAPVANPTDLFCKQDDAAGTTVGTIYYFGASPASFALFDSTNTLVTALTLTDNGSTNGIGSITVKRSASGSLTEGEQLYTLQTSDAGGHVLHSPHDFRVGQPSTQTVPRMWTLPSASGSYLPVGDFSFCGRDGNALADGQQFGGAMWFNTSDLTQGSIPFALSNQKASSPTSVFQLQLNTSGFVRLFVNDNTGTNKINLNSGTFPIAANANFWLAFELDTSTTPATVVMYYNKAGLGVDTAITFATVSGAYTMDLSFTTPRFMAAADATEANYAYATGYSGRNQFRGKVGNILMWNGLIGLGTAANRRQLWNLDNSPVARAPYSAINGVTPAYDIQGGIGDFLNGGFNQTQPVYGTRRGILGLT